MDIVSQLVALHRRNEEHYEETLSEEEAHRYYTKAINKGNLIFYTDKKGVVVGYLEWWCISFEQLGKIICREPGFVSHLEDTTSGNIAWVAGTWIREDYRKGEVYKVLRDKFFERNRDCEYYGGETRHRRHGFIKVFKRSEIMKGDSNG